MPVLPPDSAPYLQLVKKYSPLLLRSFYFFPTLSSTDPVLILVAAIVRLTALALAVPTVILF